jgi:hypothetical protein
MLRVPPRAGGTIPVRRRHYAMRGVVVSDTTNRIPDESALVMVAQDRKLAELLADLLLDAEKRVVAAEQLYRQHFAPRLTGDAVAPWFLNQIDIDDAHRERLIEVYEGAHRGERSVDASEIRYAGQAADRLCDALNSLELELAERLGSRPSAALVELGDRRG